MLNLPDRASIEAAMNQPLEPKLHSLLVDTWRRAEAPELLDLTHILVIQPGDTEEAICEAIGFSPLVHPIDAVRYPSVVFEPFWAALAEHLGYWELIHPVGNSGFAFIMLIEKSEGTWPELLEMCEHYDDGAGE